MLINLSSDIPFSYNNWNFHFFDRKKLEKDLPTYLYKLWNLKDIYLITWPWNFSTARVGTEVLNILLFLWKLEKIYYLDKLDFFNQLWYENIYLFSWNKNKFIKLKNKWVYDIVSRNYIEKLNCEETFEERNKLDLQNIKYKDILKNYKTFNWNEEKNILKACYIFEPIVG